MKFLYLVPLLLIVCAIHLTEAKSKSPQEWEAFKTFHGKKYPSAAHEQRAKRHFELTKERIATNQRKFAAGEVSHKEALNEYADEDPKEFLRVRCGMKMGNHSNHGGHHHKKHHKTTTTSAPASSSSSGPGRRWIQRRQGSSQSPGSSSPAPPPQPNSSPAPSPSPAPGPGPGPAPGPSGGGFDWRAKGAVSAVQNQGQCGDCWAFSATGAVESQIMKNGGAELDLSEEQLVDCDTTDNGCSGGLPTNAFQWLQSNGGQASLSSYPYTAGNGQGGTCQSNIQPVQKVTGFQQMQTPAATGDIQTYLQQNGPLSIGVDAGDSWQSYDSGILASPAGQADHAVLLVGWGSDSSGTPYWIVKNSWGSGWGQNGFIYLAVGDQDSGLSSNMLAYPTIQ